MGSRPKSNRQRGGIELALLDDRANERRHRAAGKGRGLDAKRNQVEHHSRERAVETIGIVGDEAEASRRGGAGEHQRQSGRAVLKIVQRLRIGRRRIGMVDALHQRPGLAGRAPGDRLCPAARG